MRRYDAHVSECLPGSRVLVADDEPQLLRLMLRVLERGGYAVRTARDGSEAVRAFEERGQAMARPGEFFEIRLADDTPIRVEAPGYRLPVLNKISAGYFAADPLDLVDLFIGSEGTLGLITAVTVELIARPPAVVTALVLLPDHATTLRLAIQRAKKARSGNRRSIALEAEEYLDELDVTGDLDAIRREMISRILELTGR